jgi:hypothetical protein
LNRSPTAALSSAGVERMSGRLDLVGHGLEMSLPHLGDGAIPRLDLFVKNIVGDGLGVRRMDWVPAQAAGSGRIIAKAGAGRARILCDRGQDGERQAERKRDGVNLFT